MNGCRFPIKEFVSVSLDVVWQDPAGKQDARMSEISMDVPKLFLRLPAIRFTRFLINLKLVSLPQGCADPGPCVDHIKSQSVYVRSCLGG